MRIRSVESGRGWQWIVEGFGLFRKAPFMWITLTLVLALIWMILFAIKLIGPLLFNLLSPVFFAGFMIGCRELEQGRELELAHVFAGFRSHAAPLVTVGGVYLVGMIVILGLIFVTAGGSMLPPALSGKHTDMAAVAAAVRGLALALIVAFVVYIPLLMAVWFAPLLVAFHGMAAVPAMKLSFRACWRNL
ncbi:MAG: BPSS1780 family membrane protein, partial [Rhodospirillaceae bacterium]